MKKIIAILFFLWGSAPFCLCHAQNIYRIRQSQADTYVVNDNDTNYVMINDTLPHINKLLVFLPGTGALPRDYYYFLQTAANIGYHAIGLGYNNDTTIGSLCKTYDPYCQGSARAEVFYGKDYSTVINVDTSECIQTRLVSLLKYLKRTYPAENWGQYLDLQDSIVWSRVCMAGHSQGAGMASLITRWYPVYRGIFLATGGDWDDTINSVAYWMEQPSQTPPSRKYSFTHRYDELFWGVLNHAPVIWDTLQIGRYINFDTLVSNYYYGHSFTSYDTAAIPYSIIRYHNCVATNKYTPIIAGKLLYRPLWQYMLADTIATGISPVQNTAAVSIYPNPSRGIFYLQTGAQNGVAEIYNVMGEEIYSCRFSSGSQIPFRINLSGSPAGMYLYRVISSTGSLIGEGKLLIQK